MKNEFVPRGLLSVDAKSPAEMKLEAIGYQNRAAHIRSGIERRETANRLKSGGGLAALGSARIFELEKRLLDFAISRTLSLDGDWRSTATYFAAMEHPEISRPLPKRGRKPKLRLENVGLLASMYDPGENLVRQLDAIMSEFQDEGKPPVQLRAIEEYIRRTDPALRPDGGSGNYYAKIREIERNAGNARTRLGKRLKRGPKKRVITAGN